MVRIPSRWLFLCAGGFLVGAGALYRADVAGGHDGKSAVAITPGICAAGGTDAADSERAFLMQTRQAMDSMMSGMSVKPTGNPDADFATMMIPHHRGAIDMAMLELCYGSNEQLRRIAQEIIVDQQQEIAAMRLALGLPAPPSASAPTEPGNPVPNSATAGSTAHTMTEMRK